MTVTIITNHRTVHLHGVLSVIRESYIDCRTNKLETVYYITTSPYEYMYFGTDTEQIKSVIIERC